MRVDYKKLIVHWIAIFAVFMSSLAPSITYALNYGQDRQNPMDFVCSVSGMKMMSSDSSAQPLINQVNNEQEKSNHTLLDDSCPYCSLHYKSYLPASGFHQAGPTQSATPYPPLFYTSPTPLFTWLKLPSRAPPTAV